MKLATYLLGLAFVLLTFSCQKESAPAESFNQAEESYLVEIDGSFLEILLDQEPEYLDGGTEGFFEAIGELLAYPVEARVAGIEGTCVIQYLITDTGTVEEITATQDPGGEIGASLIDIITTITEGTSFSPGILNGEAVNVQKTLTLEYTLG